MKLCRLALPSTAFLLFTAATFLGEPQDGPVPVAGNVSFYPGSRGGNLGFQVGEDGLLLIDDKFENTTDEVDAAIAKLSKSPPEFLVNTHYHGDHTGGNAHLGQHATIVAHDNVRVRLVEEGKPAAALPVVTYADGLSLHYNGEEVRLFHVPNAHTDGDTVVWFQGSNVIHMGDLYFQVGYPFIDVAGGGSAEGLLAGLDLVLERAPEDARLIPGHGVVTGIEGLREYRDMIATVLGRVRELTAEGFSVEEMLESGVTEEYDERWTWGFIDSKRFVESVRGSLGG